MTLLLTVAKMRFIVSVALLPLAVLSQKPPAAVQPIGPVVSSSPPLDLNGGASAAAQCAPVHIVVARACSEAPGEGTIASLATLLKQKIPGATSEALTYPAKMPYSGSLPVGVTNMKAAITKYTQLCPTGKLVLLGYSQGGAVLTDTLYRGGGPLVGPKTPKLTAQEGDPRFVLGTSYDTSTNKNKGGVTKRDRSVVPYPTWASKIKPF
ncbi:alpha/beta-hydrolase [Tothia fuscella]|uniref:Alpha/beta-hydrolase n=1 Tax=Tothia fuscella TaxID=1048955 RepID=A0A9P4NER5_9PEZI|nr:alpha/beta-hydrolase [Tothia fuscella]